MTAITLTQPWATAIALGLKRFETRSWTTSYRGPLAIHAAKGWRSDDREFAKEMAELYDEPLLLPENLPRGCIVATAVLSTIVGTAVAKHDPRISSLLTRAELWWGDFGDGRFAWHLAGVCRLLRPIPARGSLGLWDWEARDAEEA